MTEKTGIMRKIIDTFDHTLGLEYYDQPARSVRDDMRHSIAVFIFACSKFTLIISAHGYA